jgi:hypothetical protein
MHPIMNNPTFHASMPESERHGFMKSNYRRHVLKIFAKVKKIHDMDLVVLRHIPNTDIEHRHTSVVAHEHIQIATTNGLAVLWMDIPLSSIHDINLMIPINAGNAFEGGYSVGKSSRIDYLVGRLLNGRSTESQHFTTVLERAKQYSQSLVQGIVRSFTSMLTKSLSAHPDPTKFLRPETMVDLVAYFESRGNLALDTASTIDVENYVDSRDKYARALHGVKAKIRDFLAEPKWVVGLSATDYMYEKYRGHGFYVCAFDATAVANEFSYMSNSRSAQAANDTKFTVPLQYYRSLDEVPDAIKDELLANLTMKRVYLESREGVVLKKEIPTCSDYQSMYHEPINTLLPILYDNYFVVFDR